MKVKLESSLKLEPQAHRNAGSSSSSAAGATGSLTWHGRIADAVPTAMIDREVRYSNNRLILDAIQNENKAIVAQCKLEKSAAREARKLETEARRLQRQAEMEAAGKMTKSQLAAKVVELEAKLRKKTFELGCLQGTVQMYEAKYPDLVNISKDDGDDQSFKSSDPASGSDSDSESSSKK